MLHNGQYFQHIIEDVFHFYNFDVKPEIITMITSIIAGLYAVVKTIMDLIKKIKNKK